jgi:hypothetical protein
MIDLLWSHAREQEPSAMLITCSPVHGSPPSSWQTASQALATCDDFLRHGVPGNCKLEAVEGEPPRLNKGETVIDAIERYRRRGRELRADQHRIASAPYPSSYAKQRMREQIEALAMQGAPSVSSLIELDGKIESQTQRLTSEVHAERRSLAFTEVPDATALTCWLHKSALISALDREIDTEADDKAALSHEARQQCEAEVLGDLLAVERDEAALVWQAQAQNLPVEHRGDISPLAILQVRLVTAPRGSELPETGVQLAVAVTTLSRTATGPLWPKVSIVAQGRDDCA